MARPFLSSSLALLLLSSCSSTDSTVREIHGAGEDAGPEPGNGSTGGSGSDTDGDGIPDREETGTDTDGDGVPNDKDDDSDGDGIPDREEAGRDTDMDGVPDSLDADSDDDGVSDASERMRGTSPTNIDSDGDGADDLTEIGAGSDPLDAAKNPTASGNFYFRVPYQEPPTPAQGQLVFQPEIRAADVYFLVDSSVSMQGEIDAVKKNLAENILPGIVKNIPDVQVGAGEFDNCPDTFSGPEDVGVRNVASSTASATAVATAMNSISADGGTKEPYGIAAWLWATGDTAEFPKLAPKSCAAGLIGYGCVRPTSLPILVVIGDELYSQGDSCKPTKTPSQVATALNAIGAKLIVMGPTAATSKAASFNAWNEIATKTGSLDEAGKPLFFATENASDLEDDNGTLVTLAIEKLANGIPLELTATVRDDPSDAVDASRFIARVDAYAKGGIADPRNPNIICVGGLKTSDRNTDTFHEYFDAVKPGTPVCFELIAATNNDVEPSGTPQVFKAFVDVQDVLGRVYDTREIYFLVPPKPPAAGGIVLF